MNLFEYSEKTLRLRRNLLIVSSMIIAITHFDIKIEKISQGGMELSGLTTEIIVVIMAMVLVYLTFTYFSNYFIERSKFSMSKYDDFEKELIIFDDDFRSLLEENLKVDFKSSAYELKQKINAECDDLKEELGPPGYGSTLDQIENNPETLIQMKTTINDEIVSGEAGKDARSIGRFIFLIERKKQLEKFERGYEVEGKPVSFYIRFYTGTFDIGLPFILSVWAVGKAWTDINSVFFPN